jgi:hypothetical protein
MGVLEQWDISIEELEQVLSSRASLRAILIGFLAEHKLRKIWFADPRIGHFQWYDNHDRSKPGDFGFYYKGVLITVQVKSVQSASVRRTADGYAGIFQCDASDRRRVTLPNGEIVETTCLVVGGFDLLAVNLFHFDQKWRFAFAMNKHLPRTKAGKYSQKQREFLLATSVRITWPLKKPFVEEPFGLLDQIAAERSAK